MGVITLTVREPRHDQVAVRDETVTFDAAVDPADLSDGPLFVRWYSSLPATAGPPPDPTPPHAGDPPDLDKIALNPPGTTWSFTRTLWVGSQAITVAVKDQRGDDASSLAAVHRAGVAGGAPPGASVPCVVHVLVARSVIPPQPTTTPPPTALLTRASGVWAEAPNLWDEDSYQQINKLVYTWSFVPAAGNPIVLSVSHKARPDEPATFLPGTDSLPPRVGVAPLPGTLPPGDYTLRLSVSHATEPKSDSVSLPVQIVD